MKNKEFEERIYNWIFNLKQHLIKNKKEIFIRFSVFILIFTTILLIDQLTKTFIFNHGDIFKLDANEKVPIIYEGNEIKIKAEEIFPINKSDWIDWKIIGFRSIWHGGVTIGNIPLWIVRIISIIVVLFSFSATFFMKKTNWFLIVLLALVAAGSSGNELDRILFKGHVKDIFYFPFTKNSRFLDGTFNFADVVIITGIILLIVYFVISFVKETKQENREKKEQEFEEKILIAELKSHDQKLKIINTNKKIARRSSKLQKSRRAWKIISKNKK
ncbi:signal peptidase II [Mycoplasmopsis cricetuli]|uniref:signal peptidase II n=1 Tax=Mycoplasmopsis cricetuli TaxID=171283 RepID=UPI0004704880|nr:signal peptidase II [Mycoplasmopsis cricetuli]